MTAGDNRPDLLIFYGRSGESMPEQLVAGAQQAVVWQLLLDVSQTDLFRRIVLVTNEPELAASARQAVPALVVVPTGATIVFGEQLRAIVQQLQSTAVVYVGGGGAPLLDVAGLAQMVEAITTPGTVIANNLMSSDWTAFRPATALAATEPILTDNDLAWRLHHDAGLERVQTEQTLVSTLDIDTPTDLALLARMDHLPARLREYLRTHAPAMPALDATEAIMVDPERSLIVAGRINTQIWAKVEREVWVLKRLFLEERGMRASGRQARGEVRTLLAVLLQEVGPTRFFEAMAGLGDAMVFDTRPLFAHLTPHLSANDRFASDLLRPDLISDPLVRDFTAAARDSPIPVVLGGHALVTGGLWLLARRARVTRDRLAQANSA